MIKKLITISIVIVPMISSANFEITEIMYDLEGSDSGREWIEVRNTGSTQEDLSSWKFVESEVSHTITTVQGEAVIPVGGVAVIADNSTTFLLDNPGLQGSLFDSSFSLSNTGETLALKNPAGTIIDSITYSNALAAGNGKSLIRNGTSFSEHSPTPGVSDAVAIVEVSNEQTTTPTPSNSPVVTTNSSRLDSKYELSIGKDRTSMVGMPTLFEARIDGLVGLPEIVWSFGDGGTATGSVVSHMYRFPGNYIVLARANVQGASITARINITVRTVALQIDEVKEGSEGYISVENLNNYEINMTGMKIIAGGYIFEFPLDTIISSKSKLLLPNSLTGIPFSSSSNFSLVSANGKIINEYRKPSNLETPQIVATTKNVASVPLISRDTSEKPNTEPKPEIIPKTTAQPEESVIVIGKRKEKSLFWKVVAWPDTLFSWMFRSGS